MNNVPNQNVSQCSNSPKKASTQKKTQSHKLLKVLFMLFWRCVSGVHLAPFLHKWFNCCEYICFSTLGTCTLCYIFITVLSHASSLDWYFQSRPYQNKYAHEIFHNSNTRQQCPELEIGRVDVEMCEEPHIDEDAPVGSSLRRSSQKDAHDVTQSITSQAEEGARKKSIRADGAHKRPAFGFPQVLEPATSDPLYVPISDSENTKTDDDVMCLDSGEEGAPNTRNDFTYMEEMKRTQHVCADVRKMCKKFELSLAMSMHWIMRGWRLKTRILEMMHFPKKHATANICDSLLNAHIDFGVLSKNAEEKIHQSEGAMSSVQLA